PEADELGVHHAGADVDIGQEAPVAVAALPVRHQADGASRHQPHVLRTRPAREPLDGLPRMVEFGGVDAEIAHVADACDDDGVAVDHRHHAAPGRPGSAPAGPAAPGGAPPHPGGRAATATRAVAAAASRRSRPRRTVLRIVRTRPTAVLAGGPTRGRARGTVVYHRPRVADLALTPLWQ